MRVLSIIVVLAVLLVAVDASPIRKLHKKSFLEKKARVHKHKKVLPHPDQHYRAPHQVEGLTGEKGTPGKACHQLKSCEECAQLHICVWTGDGESAKCLDQRDPASVYGTRESCDAKNSNGYKDVTSKEENYTEEVANMVGDADMKQDGLGGDRVVARAIDVDDGPDAKEDKEDLTNDDPKWAKNRKIHHTHFTGYDGTTVHTKTVEVRSSKKGMPHDAPPASGEEAQITIEDSDQVSPTEEGSGDGSAAEEAQFRSKRVHDPEMAAIHDKYDALHQRVEDLEKQLGDAEDEPEDDPEDELEEEKETDNDTEYGSNTVPEEPEALEKQDNFDEYNDASATGEHEPIVKETTVTKITKNADGEIVADPEVTKSLEQLDDGKVDLNP